MADVVDPATRSRMMSGIRGKNTKPELLIRKALHARGFRYRLHCDLPGKPDICLPKYRAVIFVHGCFWHGHDCRHGAVASKTNAAFWSAKIAANRERDARKRRELEARGWHVEIVWECQLKDRSRLERLASRLASRQRGSRIASSPRSSAPAAQATAGPRHTRAG